MAQYDGTFAALVDSIADPLNAGNSPGNGPLAPGGESTTIGSATAGPGAKVNLPSTRSMTSARQQPAVIIMRDVCAGTECMRAHAYLPRAPGESQADYSERLARSVFFNIAEHTVEGLTGYVFREDPVLSDDVPVQIRDDWENLDLQGTHGDVLLREIFEDALTVGHAGILVDYPDTGGEQTHGDELREIRPYWVPIKKEDIMSWRTVSEYGRPIFSQLVIRECRPEPIGDYGEVEVTHYRVFLRTQTPAGPVIEWRLLRVVDGEKVVEDAAGFYANQTLIPFVEVPTAGKRGLLDSKPPLLDLAYLNIAHFQQWSDYATSIHKTCVPVLFAKGFRLVDANGNAVTIGPNSAINSESPDGDMKYVSHDGAALNECKASMDDLIQNMATLGVSMLASQKRVAETATAKEIDKAAADSALAVSARAFQDAAEQALIFHANFRKLSTGGSVEINKIYQQNSMDPSLLSAYVQAVAQAGVPVRYLLEAMQRYGLLGDSANLDLLELEMMGNQAAMADQLPAGTGAGGQAGAMPGMAPGMAQGGQKMSPGQKMKPGAQAAA